MPSLFFLLWRWSICCSSQHLSEVVVHSKILYTKFCTSHLKKTMFLINLVPFNERIWVSIEGSLCANNHLLSAITIHPTQQNWQFLHGRNQQEPELRITNLESYCSLKRKVWTFQFLGIWYSKGFWSWMFKIMLHLLRASKRHLNEKNQIHGWETARIWKCSVQNFQTHLTCELL